jgi:ABC-type glycerol-3-phosphate transport system permease component
VVFLASLAGYGFSRYEFRGKPVLMTAILAITGIPLLTNLLALFQMGASLRGLPVPIYNDQVYIIIVYSGFFLPLSVWIAKGFFDAIPRELDEAARVDGCTPLQSLLQITLPIATPGLTAIFLLTFVGVWNEFLAGYLLITKNDLKPAMFGMYDFLGQNLINAQLVAAACVIVALPIVVVFLIGRRSFFEAMVEGAIKG